MAVVLAFAGGFLFALILTGSVILIMRRRSGPPRQADMCTEGAAPGVKEEDTLTIFTEKKEQETVRITMIERSAVPAGEPDDANDTWVIYKEE